MVKSTDKRQVSKCRTLREEGQPVDILISFHFWLTLDKPQGVKLEVGEPTLLAVVRANELRRVLGCRKAAFTYVTTGERWVMETRGQTKVQRW